VSDSSQIINSTTSASPQGYQLSTMMSTLDATPKEKKVTQCTTTPYEEIAQPER